MSQQQQGSMEDHSHDRVFVATFMAVLAVLVGIAIVIAILANTIDADGEMSPETKAKIQSNVSPVGAVYTDASQVPAAPVKAASKERSTTEIVQSVCGGCHLSGVLNSPKIGDAAAWAARKKAAGSLEALVSAVINGKGSMPARGGDASLTDAQIRAAVEQMISN